ncbi:MAG: two-component regulator propeller domain-containing protein [Bacteroidota bacterium]
MGKAKTAISIICLWVWMGALMSANAQVSDIHFNNLSTKQGLSHASVFCILQDSKGYIWFGTKYGLNLYDGYDFQIFGKKEGLSSEYIQALYEDKDGYIWIGTFDGGLNRYDRKTGKFTIYKNEPKKPTSISSNNIYAIFQDRQRNLWIGTFGGGLCKFNSQTQTFQTYQKELNNPTSINYNDVYSILEGSDGDLWLGTYGGGLCRFDPATEKFRTYLHRADDPTSLASDDVYSLFEDKAHHLWIGTYGGGLCRFDRQTNQFTTYRHNPANPRSLSSNYVVAIKEDALGSLWVATTKGGLNRFDPSTEQFTPYRNNAFDSRSLGDDDLNALCLDRTGSMWVGTDGGGVSKFETQALAFTTFVSSPNDPKGFDASSVTALYEDKDQAVWIGTFEHGLYRYNPEQKKFTNFRNEPGNAASLSSDGITTICEDNMGFLWVGTTENGLCKFDRKTQSFTTFTKDPHNPNSLTSNAIETIFKDKQGLLWIGTYGGGINVLNPVTGHLTSYRHNPKNSKSLAGDNVKIIYQDHSDIFWIGTKESGLSRFEPNSQTFTNYQSVKNSHNSLTSNAITAISEDDLGFLWIGTFDEGLCRFDARSHSFSRFSTRGGLPDNSICGLLKDKQGRLWVSTLKGLAKLDPKSQHVRTYRAEDGLYNNIFVQWSYHAGRSGELYFGGINNFISFKPENLTDQLDVVPVYLSAFNLFNSPQKLNKPLAEMRSIELKPDQNFFSFEFVLLSYLEPEKNQYAYKLEGFDKDWNYIKTQRTASFTNLYPGTYVFRVKAADRNGVWNEAGTSIKIIVHPAWYATWWFKGSVILAIVGLSLAYYRRRIRQVERQKWILEDVVRLRTAELLMRNEEIEAQRDSIEGTNIILSAAKQTIEEQNDELKSINNLLEERVEQRTNELQSAYVKLLESNQELDTFIYRASHDIRGPVARLLGLCKVALMDVEDSKALEYFQLLDRTGEETNETLVRVLRIYDIRNIEVDPKVIHLQKFIQAITEPLQQQHPAIKLALHLPADFDFCSDERLLQIILQNVITNAFQYSLQIDTSFVKIELSETAEKEVHIRVTDNGRGVIENQRKKLFTMFFKGTTDASGAGLGLYVSRIAAQKLGGQILFQCDNPGETVVEILLPHLVSTHTEAVK